MTRWLCMANRVNAAVAKARLIWGVSAHYRNSMARVFIGDSFLIYARKDFEGKILPPLVVGAYEVVSPIFEDVTPIFTAPPSSPREVFPIRVKLKPLPDIIEPIPFKPLVPVLSFIKKKEIYSAYLQGAIRSIPEEDYQRIIAAGS